ncbi:GxxExxY protein [Cognatiluteimonas lumbrici]|uniref:GxxExxY protein n=1 Tax=Cognatiluteimonas lumbrici TaxID=2559601 RepID=UPI0011286137|nr:GxxExxY protein [Luteimonas lumbrici]
MDANSRRYIEAALTRRIIGAFYETYNLLGHGFLEGVYENALALEMEAQGIGFVRQASLEVRFKGKCVGIFRADFLVEGKVIVEIKAVEHLLPAHDAQLLNYLKATNIPLGLLLNFGPKAQVRRRIY